MDNDYGDLIIADLNFDGNEDFAIKTDSGGNGGPSYKFYTMRNDGVFKVDHFLTNEIRFYPGEIDNINKTLSTFVHADAHGYYENVWKYSMVTEKWELIISEYRKANVN